MVRVMVRVMGYSCLTPLSTFFKHILASVLLVEKTGVHRENRWHAARNSLKLYHIKMYKAHLSIYRNQTHNYFGDMY